MLLRWLSDNPARNGILGVRDDELVVGVAGLSVEEIAAAADDAAAVPLGVVDVAGRVVVAVGGLYGSEVTDGGGTYGALTTEDGGT